MHEHLVDTRERLDSFCRKMESVRVMAVDTEFLRVKTYYPRFCLMQIGSGDDVFCIDPVAVDPGTGSLREVLCAPDRTTVFHAARQDIEVLFQCFDDVPRRVFDTQVAAAMVGLGDQIGYASLVSIVTGRDLPKAHTRTDWCRRPLSPEQIEYAVDDVRYLLEIYEQLSAELDKRGRLDWVFEECRSLSDPGLYRAEPAEAYKRIGFGDRLDPVAQSVLRELANWRERTSQLMDLPRNWVVKDTVLAEIAQALPDSQDKLARLEGVSEKFVRRHGEHVVGLVRQALSADSHSVIWRKKTRLSAEQRALQQRIQDCLKRVAVEEGISPGLLSSRQDISRLVHGSRDISLLRGWRAQLLGGELDALTG